ARKAAHPRAAEFDAALAAPDVEALARAMRAHKERLVAEQPRVATRKASEMALEVVNATLPNSVGGSADLTGSNNTLTSGQRPVTPGDYSGDYIHWGIREHGMAAAMNGMALHGGFRVYGGTFLVFSDYARPAIRLSALMELPVTYVMTHDSIGLGEDGPTHQPVEHLASLRAMPNLTVIRPADAVETAEAWEIAVASRKTPVLLALSRQGLPTLRRNLSENLTARGAYVLREAEGGRDVTLIATGSEVEVALRATDLLAADGIRAAVVSAPSFELFRAQGEAYWEEVLGDAPRVGVEAAVEQGWNLFLRRRDRFVGMRGFGASAPAADLYRHFGITPEAVAEAARGLL
ncbi:MAG: transketolase, partial [Alphaproteobacteria bacterium]